MTHHHRPWMPAMLITLCVLSAGPVCAQFTAPNNPNAPIRPPQDVVTEPVVQPAPMVPAPAAAAIYVATALAREPLTLAVERALSPSLMTAPVSAMSPAPVRSPAFSPALAPALSPAPVSGPRPMAPAATAMPAPLPVSVGSPVGEGVRVLRAPSGCTPKTNSLDCVQDSSDAGQGANVSGRVRNSVIGEVGAGRATTEGAGGAQRQQACTPKPGELSCTP